MFRRWGILHKTIVGVLAMAVMLFGAASFSYAITPWHTVNMEPGTTYDVSKAKKNTTVRIDKSGSFYLTGTSKYCRVVIGSTNATVVLDNLNLKPGIYSYVGSRTASITVNNQGGTVTLMSKAGTTNEFASYLGAPAIRKDSANTRLVFETSNPDNPGTINAYPDSIAGSVGIGCIAGKDNTAGNIVINSGIINASGTKGGAGIGAGKKANVDGITINGGSVKAVAPNASTRYQNGQGIEERGAGIGTTYKGTARNITINGGTVNAIGCRHDDIQGGYGEGAGIGGGSHSNAENITINGGKVYAHGGTSQSGENYSASPHTGAAGIGGGADGSAVNIVINGGNIEAHGGVNACGIGTGSVYSSPLYSSVKITGGEVKAYADFEGTGIGSTDSIGSASVVITGGKIIADGGAPNPSKAFQRGGGGICVGTSQGKGTIAISGGYIQASGSKFYSAIGGFSPKNPGGWYKIDEDFTDTISISGGTIEAKGGDESISAIGGLGSYAVLKKDYYPCNVYISGGNIKCTGKDNGKVWGTPKNKKDGQDVFCTGIALEGTQGEYVNKAVAEAEFENLDYKYGLQDVKLLKAFDEEKNPQGGYVWFYLPKETSAYCAKIEDEDKHMVFMGDVEADTDGILRRAREVTLKALEDGEEGSDGSAFVYQGCRKLMDVTAPKIKGYTFNDYTLVKGESATGIVKDNELVKSIPGYTDDEGKWIPEYSENGQIFYAVRKPIKFNIHFNSHKPAAASEEPTGTIEDMEVEYGVPKELPTSGFSLKGYKLGSMWLGRDSSLIGDEDACRLTATEGDTVTLYANWEPKKYTIRFMDGDKPAGSQVISYNEHINLKSASELGLKKEGYRLAGWSTGGFGSFYDDQEDVCNLCSFNGDEIEGKILNAIWVPDATVSVTVTNDGEPVTILGKITLSSDTQSGIELTYNSDRKSYEAKYDAGTQIPAGKYSISIDSIYGFDTEGCTIDVTENGGTAVLDYYTVEAQATGPGSENATVSLGKASNGAKSGGSRKLEKVLDNSKVSVTTELAGDNYTFDRYTASGVQPQWQDNKPELITQEITIKGKTCILANIREKRYTIAFAKNAENAAGDMAYREMTFGEERALPPCGFEREGYEFAEWTATAEWGGTTYKDCQKVKNLARKDGETVTLYAQWNPDPYYIDFDDNGGIGLMLSQKCFRDIKSALSQNEYSLPNHHFTGWNTESRGTGTSYRNEAEVRNLTEEKNGRVTLYAQWKPDTYVIRFDANGGKGTMAEQEMFTNMTLPLDFNRFTKKGYRFVGWSVTRDGHSASYKDGAPVYNLAKTGGKITLYAQWIRDKNKGQGTDTGDNAKIILAVVLMAVALAAAFAVWRRKRI